jgi:ribosome-binding protein aMBF1 (putative translation factor)
MAQKCKLCGKKAKILKGEYYYTVRRGRKVFLCNDCLKEEKKKK